MLHEEKGAMPVEAKEFLNQYRNALITIRNLEAEAEELELLAMNTTISIDGERVQSSGRKDRMAELAAKLADIEIELMDKRTEALSIMRKVGQVIASVENPDYRQLLHMRYVERHTWEEIAVGMHRNYRWILRLHGRALENVAEILNRP